MKRIRRCPYFSSSRAREKSRYSLKTIVLLAIMAVAAVAAGIVWYRTRVTASPYLNMFEIVWQTVNEEYFDPTFGGIDWDDVHDRYRPMIAATKSDDEFYILINKMLWELNVSHCAIAPPGALEEMEPSVFAEGGIGIDIRLVDGYVVVTSVKSDSPGYKAGLRPGFVIHSIDGNSIEEIAEEALQWWAPPRHERGRTSTIVSSIRGRLLGSPNTTVSLVYLDEQERSHEVGIIRRTRKDRIVPDSEVIPPYFVEFEAKRLKSNISYIRFNAFMPPIDQRFSDIIESMANVRGLIVDIRGNAGGVWPIRKLLAETLVTERILCWKYIGRNGIREAWLEPSKTIYEGPVVVLVDALSASSSEEFAGSLQALGRVTIVGRRTSGRVLVGGMKRLSSGALFMYPIEQTQTANGTILEGRGVIPDIDVSLNRTLLLQGLDSQLEAAIEYINSVTDGSSD